MRIRSMTQSLWHDRAIAATPALRAVFKMLARRKSRRALAILDGHLLQDIGLSPTAANAEASKPFWRE